jgi:DNA-binding MarR family transcriptional regulator
MAKFKYFKKAGLNIDGDITLSSQEFRLLSLIDENKEIGMIVRESGMDIHDFKGHMAKFYKMGLIIPVVKKIIQRYSSDFLQELIAILTYYVGPVATIIMTDILSDMNIRDKKIPVEDLEKLLFKVTDEISDINQKIEFNNQVKKLLLRT